jgi:hypothetical protein
MKQQEVHDGTNPADYFDSAFTRRYTGLAIQP